MMSSTNYKTIPDVRTSSDNKFLLFYNSTSQQHEVLSAYITPTALIKVGEYYEYKIFEFLDFDSKLRKINIPLSYFSGSSDRIEILLRQYGFDYPASRKRKAVLFEYITAFVPELRLIGVDKYGWSEDLSYFNFGGNLISKRHDLINTLPINSDILLGGDIKKFNQEIVAFLPGNSRLILAYCAAFSAPLLKLLRIASFGLHFYSSSSIGKSLVLFLICAAIGKESYLSQWQATTNGIEGLAKMSNHLPLILDEISQFRDYSKLEAVVMMIINGVETARLDKNSNLLSRNRWDITVLSSGNQTLTDLKGANANVATEIRILNIPADTGKFGILEELHHFKSSFEFVKYLENLNSKPNPVFSDFLLQLVHMSKTKIKTLEAKLMKLTQNLISGRDVHGQIYRVAEKFAAMQLAGELAHELGIWSLPLPSIENAINQVFEEWFLEFGDGDKEHRQILEQFTAGLQSRLAKFIDLRGEPSPIIPDPLYGYLDDEYYYLTATGKNLLLAGFNLKYAIELLHQKQLLIKWSNNSFTKVKRIGERTEKLYFISRKTLDIYLQEE